MEKRQSNFELLRIIAMFMIVVHHVDLIIPNWPTSLAFVKNFTAYSFGSFGKSGVDIFALLTGYFMYAKKFKFSKFICVWLDVDFYSWLTLFFLFMLDINLSLKQIITFLFPVLFSLRWYATAYLLLYILSPYINVVIRKITFKQYIVLLLILLFTLSIMPTIKQNFAYSDTMWLMFVYLIGAFISKNKLADNISILKELIVLISSFGLIILSIPLIGFVNSKISDLKVDLGYLFLQNSSFMVLIFSIALFLLFSKLRFTSNFVNSLSKLMFGIYLSHGPILKIFLPKYVTKISLIDGQSFYIYLIIAPIIIFIVFSLIEFLRLKLLGNVFEKISKSISDKLISLSERVWYFK